MNTDSPNQSHELPAPPALCRIGVGILGVALTLSAIPWMWFAIGRFGGFDWGFFGFELLTGLAGIYAILFGLGKYKDGWAIGVTALNGSILVALVFGLFIGFIKAKQTDFPELANLAKYTLYLRVAAIAGFTLFASAAVFARDTSSLGFLFKSALLAAPIAAVAVMMNLGFGPGAWINNALAGGTGTGGVQAVLALTLGLFFIVFASAAGHLLIRAYECGRPSASKSE